MLILILDAGIPTYILHMLRIIPLGIMCTKLVRSSVESSYEEVVRLDLSCEDTEVLTRILNI